ncbi:PoNe immunity protein domain-containing protein [Luteibacter sp. 22Crub2.1]|uniref:PoNe immunity protein domain-containing protein n=1 Tax=Luteibacter sp. 22Crub2.1 TaxID=1283288 RepID=UPI0009A670B9|nr:PoNe immunity protein domain-containing protein [Luteibacter sp. 22Crub2.1]SKC08635.1 protein of unknown function [Luteibacter sp. 22Crub2.1]
MRDTLGSDGYWEKWVSYKEARVIEMREILAAGPMDAAAAQYAYRIATTYIELMLLKYSRGDDVASICALLPSVVDAWEHAERIGERWWSAEIQNIRHSWALNLDFYQRSFWLVGFALAGSADDQLWLRLLRLIGNEGEDALLDSVIASRQAGRKIGASLCFPKAYGKLLDVIRASSDMRGEGLRAYLADWYSSLDGAGNKSVPIPNRTPYWHGLGDENFEGGAYFGRWCVEAVAVVVAFSINDSACLDSRYYPADLIRDGRAPIRQSIANAVDAVIEVPQSPKGFLARIAARIRR